MRKQYTKIYYDNAGNVLHVATQDSPFVNEPIDGDPRIAGQMEFELEHEEEFHINADILRESMGKVDVARKAIDINANMMAARVQTVRETLEKTIIKGPPVETPNFERAIKIHKEGEEDGNEN
jgi:hypothetical protein